MLVAIMVKMAMSYFENAVKIKIQRHVFHYNMSLLLGAVGFDMNYNMKKTTFKACVRTFLWNCGNNQDLIQNQGEILEEEEERNTRLEFY